jgi:hypothetical protein
MDFNLLSNSMVDEISDIATGFADAENRPVTNIDTANAIDSVLNNGITYASLGEEGIFIIASVETYLKAAEIGILGDYNAYSSVETYLKLAEAIGFKNRQISGFTESVEQIFDVYPNMDNLMDKGIVEVGNFSILPLIIADNLIDEVFLQRILDKGIVLSRISGNVYISSVDMFINTLTSIGEYEPTY